MRQMRGVIGMLMFGALGWVAWSDAPTGFAEVSPGIAAQIRGGSTPDPACKGYMGTAQRCCTGSMNNFTNVYQADPKQTSAKPLGTPNCGANNDKACFANQYDSGQRCN